jgi:5-methylcytosine-specific restriction protein A
MTSEEEMQEDLETAFHQKALEIYETTKKECGYNAVRFLQKIHKDGGLGAAKAWLRERPKGDKLTKGFLKLLDYGRIDISLEAVVLQEPWNTLFTPAELSIAQRRLQKYGHISSAEPVLTPAPLTVGEEEPSERFSEGHATRVSVNAYERNPQARQACMAHYGACCYVCHMDFGERYGPTVEGFIHVHHLCPLSAIGEAYEVDPVADLRPVCPNCHAVIHSRKPPYSMEEVRRMLAAGK